MMLSKNFSLDEMTRSTTASKKRIENVPNAYQIENLVELCENVLQPLREAIGPIYISSGFRSQKLNVAIGGSTTSQHCALKGAAADIDMGDKNKEIFNFIKDELIFDQLIWEFGDEQNPSWVHVSYHYGHNRKQILKAVKINGKTKYINF
jgi:zinc D-Ala-D-Ala carboxypeptidase